MHFSDRIKEHTRCVSACNKGAGEGQGAHSARYSKRAHSAITVFGGESLMEIKQPQKQHKANNNILYNVDPHSSHMSVNIYGDTVERLLRILEVTEWRMWVGWRKSAN